MTPQAFQRRSTSARILAALLVVLGGLTAGGDAGSRPDASEILRRAERVRSPDLDYVVDFRLVATNPASSWKRREARYTLIAHGKDHSLVLMRKPESFYPGTLLITEGRYWLLLPRSSKPFQLAPRHVLNGDIANGDLARGNLLAYYAPRLDGEEVVDGEPCYRLELRRTSYLGMYPRIVAWIAKVGSRPWKLAYYGETGALLKEARYHDYERGELGTRSMRIEVTSHTRPGETTTLLFSDLRPIDASPLRFEPPALVEFRDAARAKLEADGVQARAEDLVAVLRSSRP